MKVLVCGSRSWTDEDKIRDRLSELPSYVEIVTGGARGADSMADRQAGFLHLVRTVFYADWEREGLVAGRRRNLRMLDYGPELVIAFWDGSSPGTRHTIFDAKRRGIEVEVIVEEKRAA